MDMRSNCIHPALTAVASGGQGEESLRSSKPKGTRSPLELQSVKSLTTVGTITSDSARWNRTRHLRGRPHRAEAVAMVVMVAVVVVVVVGLLSLPLVVVVMVV